MVWSWFFSTLGCTEALIIRTKKEALQTDTLPPALINQRFRLPIWKLNTNSSLFFGYHEELHLVLNHKVFNLNTGVRGTKGSKRGRKCESSSTSLLIFMSSEYNHCHKLCSPLKQMYRSLFTFWKLEMVDRMMVQMISGTKMKDFFKKSGDLSKSCLIISNCQLYLLKIIFIHL